MVFPSTSYIYYYRQVSYAMIQHLLNLADRTKFRMRSCALKLACSLPDPRWVLPVLSTERLLGREDLPANCNFADMSSRLVHKVV